jgi:hypothetical protein
MYLARTVGTAVCVGVLTLFSACGSTDARPTIPSATAQGGYSSAPASSTCRPGPHSVCLTRSAGGHTIELGVGWTVGLELQTPSGVWSVPAQAGAQLLRQLGAVRRNGGGVAVSYRALAPGRTTLRAFERPVCPPMRACPQYILVWQVELRVSRG